MRELLARMDVPTRQSYTLALVAPSERTFASGVTNLTRNISWAAAPSLAGWLMQSAATLSVPLFCGAGLKIVYDLLLFAAFRRTKAPEES
jgi:predicted MFS family arabinose efflux permease